MRPFIFLSISLLIACKKDFLELKDSASLNKQSSIVDLKTMGQFVNGIHLMVSRDYAKGIASTYPEVVADNLKPNTLRSPMPLAAHYKWVQRAEIASEITMTNDAESLNSEWRSGYLDIRACNFVVETIHKFRNENPELADEYKGQALAIRAMIALKLVNLFAQNYRFSSNASHPGIPYITVSEVTAPYHRSTVAEVYEFIIRDFKEAIDLLPDHFDTRYMNKMAAKALLARTYLYKSDHQNANKIALEVTAAVPLMSIAAGYPNGISMNLPPDQSEVLYQLTPGFIEGQSTIVSTQFISQPMRSSAFFATLDIVNMLNEDPNDVRAGWVFPTGNNWRVFKYPTAVANGLHSNPVSDYYQPVIRSSEMFLTVAESAAQIGNEHMARDYLNAVRLRANPYKELVVATGTALLDSIYKERRKELAFEGTRMFDIQRWQLPVKRIDAHFESSMELTYPNNRAIAPIPLLDVQQAGISQNLDY